MKKKYTIFVNAIISKPIDVKSLNKNVADVGIKNNLVNLKNRLFKNLLK